MVLCCSSAISSTNKNNNDNNNRWQSELYKASEKGNNWRWSWWVKSGWVLWLLVTISYTVIVIKIRHVHVRRTCILYDDCRWQRIRAIAVSPHRRPARAQHPSQIWKSIHFLILVFVCPHANANKKRLTENPMDHVRVKYFKVKTILRICEYNISRPMSMLVVRECTIIHICGPFCDAYLWDIGTQRRRCYCVASVEVCNENCARCGESR